MRESLETLLLGLTPEEAEGLAATRGLSVVWCETEPPRWLSEARAPRVARVRLLPDGRLELLRAQFPLVSDCAGDETA
jgi:hypothetical protein